MFKEILEVAIPALVALFVVFGGMALAHFLLPETAHSGAYATIATVGFSGYVMYMFHMVTAE